MSEAQPILEIRYAGYLPKSDLKPDPAVAPTSVTVLEPGETLNGYGKSFMPSFSNEAPADGQVWTWEQSSALWKPKTPTGGGGTDAQSVWGRPIDNTVTPLEGHVMRYRAAAGEWEYGFLSAADLPSGTDADRIQGIPVDDTTPDPGAMFIRSLLTNNYEVRGLAAQDVSSFALLRNGSVPLTGDWDNTGRRIRNTGTAEYGSTAPLTPAVGMVWHDTVSNVSKIWNGAAWVDVAAAVPPVTFAYRSLRINSTGDDYHWAALRPGDSFWSPSTSWYDQDAAGFVTRRQLMAAQIQDPNMQGTQRWRASSSVPLSRLADTNVQYSIIYWQHSTGTGTVEWATRVGFTAVGEEVQPNSVTLTERAVPGTQYATDALTIALPAGTFENSDTVTFEVARNSAADTFAGTVGVIGIVAEWIQRNWDDQP